MYALTGQINELLGELFDKMNIILVDFKIELGKTMDGKIVLADEISPDTCRLWDKDTMKNWIKTVSEETWVRLPKLTKKSTTV